MKLFIPDNIHKQIMFWVNKSNFEMSGFGLIHFDPKAEEFVVSKVYLLEQENDSASTEMMAEGISNLLYDTRKEEGDLRWWFHSHVNMPVFWSGTDHKAMQSLSKDGWFLHTVFNKKNQMRTAYTQNIKGAPNLMIDEIETIIYDNVSEEQKAEWTRMYDQNVKIKHSTLKKGSFTEKKAEPLTKEEKELLEKSAKGLISQKEFEDEMKKIKASKESAQNDENLARSILDRDVDEFYEEYIKFQEARGNKFDFEGIYGVEGVYGTPGVFGDQIIMNQIIEAKKNKAHEDDDDFPTEEYKNWRIKYDNDDETEKAKEDKASLPFKPDTRLGKAQAKSNNKGAKAGK